jgi:hypothetical protein
MVVIVALALLAIAIAFHGRGHRMLMQMVPSLHGGH